MTASITACILARNEEHRIEEALKSLQGWTDEIVVIDNESDDGTVAVARRYTPHILNAPRASHFDAARNLAIEHASGSWLFYLDADERVPARLGRELHRLVAEHGEEFEALHIPFKHYFCGKWMQHSGWWPGYTRPQLLKKGRFRYNARLHSGVEVQGRKKYFPADDPELAIVHYSYDNLHHYLEKLNRYTDGEAESLRADGQTHSWQSMLAHFVGDWKGYYDDGRADLDGMNGFVLSFMSAFYRFASRAKLWDLRRQHGELAGADAVPANLQEMLEFMAHVAREGARPWLEAPPAAVPPNVARVPLLWQAPLLDPSGYADEARQFVLGLLEAGEPLALAPLTWSREDAGVGAEVRALLDRHTTAPETPCELFISHTLPALQRPSPHARFNIARTMFETDRLPAGWEKSLNAMDRIWVPSEFNRETFVRSGVDPRKLAVVPGAIDPAPFTAEVEPWPVPGQDRFRFLSVFDWTLHKGWDVLLEAFAGEFGLEDSPRRHGDTERDADGASVGLVLKVWSSHGYTLDDIREQADTLLQEKVGRPLSDFPNIHLWWEAVPAAEMPRLYRAVDAFVLPTRGEGWCRPLMEAMASGLPTIATAWSGLTAFHNERVGYPLKYQLVPVSAAGAREIPIYTGHCWAEPDLADLQRLLRRLVTHAEAARKKGAAAQQMVAKRYSRRAVTEILRAELAQCRNAECGMRNAECGIRDGTVGGDPSDRNSAFRIPHSALGSRPLKPKANPLTLEPAAAVDFRAALGRPLRVRWEGDQSILSSLALVNRELCLGLLDAGDVELTIAERQDPWHTLTEAEDPRFGALFARRNAALSGPADVTIRHHFPPDWSRPETGKLVVIQPWEYGHLPREWVAGATNEADEVWAYSRFVRDVYVRSGVRAEKVRVVPLGFNPEIFTRDGPRYPLATSKSLRFLFAGGALERKGADLLLEAYLRSFTARDDVCLVVKDMGTRTFYQGQTLAEAFRRAQAQPGAPEILYLDADLSDAELAALYRACSCVVLPYRGEGFGLPPLEGMACGLPAIVTAGGPTEDYLNDEVALRVPHHRRPAGRPNVGPFECVGDPWQIEPDLQALADALRWLHDHREEIAKRGAAARAFVERDWTWAQAAARVRERLLDLVAPPAERPLVPAKLWSEPPVQPRGDGARGRGKGKKSQRPKGPPSQHPIPNTQHPTKVELSLCMIVRDEEPRIASCLKSIAPFVDEIIAVDTGSKDRTREIARECGARVFDFPWVDSFADARNQSLAQARGSWIFWLDADDVISPECGRELRGLIRRNPKRDAAYQVQVRIPPGPGEFSESVVDHVKLFPNRPDLRFEQRIHEQVLPAIRRAGLQVLFSDLYVTHQNYDRSAEGQAKKRRRDFRLLELDLRDQPEHPFVLFNLGMTHLHATKEFEVAAHYLRRSLDRSHWQDSIVRKAYAMLATARICQEDWCAALDANEEGRRHYPEDAELLFQAGQVYQQVGQFEEARRALERLVAGKEDPHYRSVDVGLRTYRGRHELALLFRRMGDAPHCERVLREIAAAHTSYLPAQLDLAETLLALGNSQEAKAVLARVPEVEGVREELGHLRERVWGR